jgi:hypothetical protein
MANGNNNEHGEPSGSHASAGAQNRKIYEPKFGYAYRKKPTSLNFYYIVVNDNHTYNVKGYFYDQLLTIEGNHLKKILPYLIQNADTGAGVPPDYTETLNSIEWARKSHIVIVIKSSKYEIDDRNPIVFYRSGWSEQNPCFFDGKDLHADELANSVNNLSGIRFVNHMKSEEDGPDLGHQNYEFKVRVFLRPRDRSIADDDWYISGAGTNLGPPVPPPA